MYRDAPDRKANPGIPRREASLADPGADDAYERWTVSARETEWPAVLVDGEASMNERCPPPAAETRETTCRTAMGAADMVEKKTVGERWVGRWMGVGRGVRVEGG